MKPKRKQRLLDYFNEQGGVCVYCKEEMTLELNQKKTATIEHVRPTSQGGDKGRNNEVCACADCNSRKSDQSVVSFLRKEAKRAAEEGRLFKSVQREIRYEGLRFEGRFYPFEQSANPSGCA